MKETYNLPIKLLIDLTEKKFRSALKNSLLERARIHCALSCYDLRLDMVVYRFLRSIDFHRLLEFLLYK